MSLVFSERALLPERMDMEPLDPATTRDIVGALEHVNAWLGGVHATLSVLKRFARRWQPGQKVRFIDWGTGSADIPRAIVRWCRKQGHQAEIVGIDMNNSIVDYAREACREYPEITILECDFNAHPSPLLPLPSGRGEGGGEGRLFDYAISSLCLHHLSNEEVIDLLRRSDHIARRGIIMNDLKRSARAWAWIWGLSRIMKAHPIVQHDGPASVRNAFTKPELEYVARQAGLSYARVETHFGYRYTLAGEKI